MRPREPLHEALRVLSLDGEVVFLGEGAASFSMTRDAARQTLRNLADALRPEVRLLAVILLVEDEPLIRELGVAVLQEAGFRVVAAGNASEALQVLETGLDPKVLFTDVHMPGDIDGLQLARAARDRLPQIEVLVSSGEHFPEGTQLPDRGRFLRKPYALEEMVRQIGELAHG